MLRAFITALVIVAALPAAAQQTEIAFPERRAGQWEIRMVSEEARNTPPMVIQHCTDAATDRQMMQAGLSISRELCQRYEMRREGGGIVIDAACQIGPIRSTSRSVVTGDFRDTYQVRVEGTTEGAPGIPAQRSIMTQTARWVSATCASGLVPGDMLMPGGMKMNVREFERLMQRRG